MTLTQLNYILAVDRCRNFAQAARESFVTQPTLSMQIQKLEDYLQVIIFDRSRNPVVPTPVGEKILEHARKVMKEAQELEELSRQLRGDVSGEYILGVIPTLAPYILPLFVTRFTNAYPKVELKIHELQTDDIIRLLNEGKIDGGILAAPLEEKKIHEEHLFFEPFQIFLSPDHHLLGKRTINEKDLDISEAWLLKQGHCLRSQALQLCQSKKKIEDKQLYFEAGSLETLINLVKSSSGFTILPLLAGLNLSLQDQKLLRDFKGHVPMRDICFVSGALSMKKSIESALIKCIITNLPKEMKKKISKGEVIPLD